MSKILPIGILQHYFQTLDPANTKSLKETMNHFQMRDLEATDYRSAYHQFSDWLYGWSVSDGADQMDMFSVRQPRDIVMSIEREKQDAQRLMKTFETLTSLSLRHLKVCYSDIEQEMPRLGQGLDTFLGGAKKMDYEDEYLRTGNALEKVWGDRVTEHEPMGLNEIPEGDLLLQSEHELALEKVKTGSKKGSLAEPLAVYDSQNLTKGHEDMVVYSSGILFEHPMGSVMESEEKSSSAKGSFQFLAKIASEPKVPIQREASEKSEPSEQVQTTEPAVDTDEPIKALRRDIDHVFREVDQCAEYTLLTISSVAAVLSFAELLGDKESFSKANLVAHELSQGFVSNTLKTIWDLLNKELPQQTNLATLRNTIELKGLIQKMIALRAVDGVTPKLKVRKLHHKLATLHELFVLVDIHLLPNFAHVHKEGVKCAQFSVFDSNLWLTGGHDAIIRITDIRPSNKHICLAQYVGHKSIISDVHFAHDDSYIVSSSYDRTVKIWNARSAIVDKTLHGHLDAVTSCDVSPDGRYIASSSLDNTVRFWDFATGECITVIKKHTKWVKIVRFSPDSRYLATASLDRKVYLWDTKILANSRSPSHNRCLDNFNDYVLDMVFIRPSLLLTTSRDSTLRMFDYMTGHELHSFQLSPSWACTLSVSSNEEYFATGSFDNNINIFRVKDFVRVREIRAFNLGIMCIRFPTDLSYLIAGTQEGFIQQITL